MKPILVFVMVIFSYSAFAQYQSNEKTLYLQKYNKFKGMKGGGIALTVIGAVVTVVGFSNIGPTTTTNSNNGSGFYTSTEYNSGVLIASLGITAMGGGITLWAIGNKKMKFYKRKLDGLSLNLKMTPMQQGLSLNYRFH
jgi:hypothetical protein